MKELVEKISGLMESFSKDAKAQLEAGNKAAGTRGPQSIVGTGKALKEFRKVSVEASK